MASAANAAKYYASLKPDPVSAPTLDQLIVQANRDLQSRVPGAPSIGAMLGMLSPLEKYVEIIRNANSISRRSVRTVGGASIPMEPVQPGDTQEMLPFRVLVAWLVLAQFAPRLLAQATGKYLLDHGIWNKSKFDEMVNNIKDRLTGAGQAVQQVGQQAYADAIWLWHKGQPTFKGSLVTSGPAYDIWLRTKPPTPPGLTTLSGGIFGSEANLRGLSGKALKRAYRAMHGLGDPNTPGDPDFVGPPPDGSGTPPQDTPSGPVDPPPGQPNPPPAQDAGTQNAPGGSSTPGVPQQVAAQGAAILTGLLNSLLATGAGMATHELDRVTGRGGPQGPAGGWKYDAQGHSNPQGHDLPTPPPGKVYDSSGRLVDDSYIPGVPNWAAALAAAAGGWFLLKK